MTYTNFQTMEIQKMVHTVAVKYDKERAATENNFNQDK